MPCPFESDMVLILCRSTGIRDAQEEKDTSSINGTCRSSACFPGLSTSCFPGPSTRQDQV
ncbi:hypothetical protein DPMN_187698 [Dreissena polymorpha]|uniref:Uncharacterized protein n=1 Tax=Dreissena polymorpha TaxID=45954 RepID=A0A9D4IAL6_DREPO|nr:hypothetical protein DPMN_187698 [Dreissena polymorpha]